MRRPRQPLPDDNGNSGGNFFGFIAVVVLVAVSLLVLLRLQHFVARRDCYVQHINACASVGSGRYPHF